MPLESPSRCLRGQCVDGRIIHARVPARTSAQRWDSGTRKGTVMVAVPGAMATGPRTLVLDGENHLPVH
jgi:hypothetical protein